MLVYVIVLFSVPLAHTFSSDIYLSGIIIPKHYDLQYIFDLEPQSRFSYVGVVSIVFTVNKEVSKIILHSDTLTISENKVNLASDGVEVPAIIDIEMSDLFDFLVISLSNNMSLANNYTLTIPFSGVLNREPYGLFLTSYKEYEDKPERLMLLSNFNPAGAHRAFPCFDEPKYKATFSIVIGHNINIMSISNMPISSSTNIKIEKEVFVWDQFARTPRMSTYLVAIVLTHMASMIKPKVKDNQVEIKMWSRGGKTKAQLNNGASLIQKIAAAHYDFLKTKFPLPTLEVIAMPAMTLKRPCYHHWGLMVCLEDMIFYNKEEDTGDMKELSLAELTQKIALQWIDGLVSPRSWQDAWINEGLSRVLVPLAVEQIDREDKFRNNYVIQNLLRFLHSDSVKSALPLRIPIDEPRDILDAQNSDLHGKAFLVMNMIYKLMSYESFATAVRSYLRENSYSVGDFDSFTSIFSAFFQQNKLPALASFKEMLETWIQHEGYPVLKVSRDDFSDTALKLNQQHYVSPKYEATTAAWWIPFSVNTKETLSAEHYWLPVDDGLSSHSYVVQTINVRNWIFVNAESLTPMRVCYDEKNWITLSQILSSDDMESIPVVARAQLVSDAFALAWSNHIDYNIPINLVSYLANETEWSPFHAAFMSLDRIDNALTASMDYTVFQRFVAKLIHKVYRPSMGFQNTNDLFYNKLQIAAIQWACMMKYPDCEQSAIAYFDDWMKTENPNKNPIPYALRRVVYAQGVARGSHEQWQFVVERANSTPAARIHLLLALMHTTDLPLLKTALEWTLNDEMNLQPYERVAMLCEALQQSYSYPVVRELIYKRTDLLLKRGGDDIGELMRTLTRKFTTPQELTEFNSWSEKYQLALDRYRLWIRQGVDYAKGNIDWMSNNQARVIALMKKNSPAPKPVNHLSRRKDLKNFFSKDYVHNVNYLNTGSRIIRNKYLYVLLSLLLFLSCWINILF